MNYAMIITTSVMLSTLGIQTNTEILKQMCVLLHGEITEEAHPGKNLVCRIFNYISCSYRQLAGIKWTLDREKKPIKVEILESTFEQILEQIGATDKKTAVRVLLDEGYLVTPEKNRIKAKISIDGVVSYGYRFCYPKIDEAFGPVNDAVYTYKRQSLGPMQIMEEEKLPMEEITRLQISRNRLRESFFYYDGCDTEKQKASDEEAADDRMIDLAADVLVAILMEERAS